MDASPPMHTSGNAYAPSEEVVTISSSCLGKNYKFFNDGSVAIVEIQKDDDAEKEKLNVSSATFVQEYRAQSLFGRISFACLPDGSFGYTFFGYRPTGKGTSVQVTGNFNVNSKREISSTGVIELPYIDLQGFDRRRYETIQRQRQR